ncbi:tetratricopeptide repeat protein [Truepera radiovictrix]|nr:tetratricopeptide repeat protein [Truepera radiovictrix]WMT58489.1 tetratricopeptide repeat protein [Truepera radiovictrix]
MRALLALLLLPVVWAQELTERSTDELLRYGDVLYAQGNCLSARLFYQQVLEREANNPDALLGKGQALVCEGAFDEGIATLQRVLEAAPERTEAYLRLASAYVEQHRNAPQRHTEGLQEALAVLEEAESAGLGGAELLNLRGMILYRRGELEAARDALQRAVALDSTAAAYYENLGLTYLGLGELEPAVRTLRRAVTLNPDSASARNQLGSAYLLLGRCEDALFELEQAVSLAPEQLETNFNLGRALFDCGEVRAARPYFEKVVALDVTALPPVYTYLARIDLEEGNYDAAVTQATKGALLPQPNAAEAYYWLGQAYEARGRTSEDGASDAEKAREAYERALQLDGSFTPAREALN